MIPFFPAPRRAAAAALLATFLAACGRAEQPATHRLVLVFDPTVLRDADPALFAEKVGAPLRQMVDSLPEASTLDLFLVGVGQVHQPPDLHVTLPFDAAARNDSAHRARVAAAADRVVAMARARWAESNESPNRPASCILTALQRTAETVDDAHRAGEEVTLVVVSDFLEACGEMGAYNFEREIPDSAGALAMEVDLSRVDRLVMLRMETAGLVSPAEAQRLEPWWRGALERWKVPPGAVRFRSSLPADGVLGAASAPGH